MEPSTQVYDTTRILFNENISGLWSAIEISNNQTGVEVGCPIRVLIRKTWYGGQIIAKTNQTQGIDISCHFERYGPMQIQIPSADSRHVSLPKYRFQF